MLVQFQVSKGRSVDVTLARVPSSSIGTTRMVVVIDEFRRPWTVRALVLHLARHLAASMESVLLLGDNVSVSMTSIHPIIALKVRKMQFL